MFNFKKVVSYVVAGLTVAFTLSTQEVQAASSVLALKVTGSIAATPQWTDAGGAALTALTFNFQNLFAGASSNAVSSTAQSAKLVNALVYPANVALARPAGCAIGGSAVADTDVILVHGTTDLASNSILSISADLQNFSLKFGPGYGDKVGAVTCGSDGSLTYSY